MRSEPKQHHHQQQKHHRQQPQIKTTYLPMFCTKPSSIIKNVHIPNPFNKNHHHSSTVVYNDPSLSPKVGCMGQLKKKNHHQQHHHHNYNLGMVFPTTSYTTKNLNTQIGQSQYCKLLCIFSNKKLLSTATTTTTTTSSTIDCGKDHYVSERCHSRLRSRSCDNGNVVIGFGSPIDVVDLDPPLPVVIKKMTNSLTSLTSLSNGESNVINSSSSSLWKRRSGGASTLKGLEIQHVHIPIQSSSTLRFHTANS